MSTKEKRQNFITRITASADAGNPGQAETLENALSQEAAGVFQQRVDSAVHMKEKKIERQTLLHVDANRCRIWDGNPRRYDLLDEKECEDLINSLRDEGQKEPALARPVMNDPAYDFEIIVGTRRHWTARHLGVQLIIRVDETLTDEQSFRRADTENRNRDDVSDYERAVNYQEALKRYYNNHQGELAKALKKNDMWVSRFLDLAKLPKEIVAAYPNVKQIKIEHAKKLKPLLDDPKTATKVMDAARAAHGHINSAQELLAKLLGAVKTRKIVAKKIFELKTGTNKSLLKAELNKAKGKLTLQVELKNGASEQEIQKAIKEALAWAKK